MNTKSDNSMMQGDAVESLLERAEPRPAPPPQMEADVRAAVRSDWAAVTGRRRRWSIGRNVAIAASLILAVVFAFTGLQQSGVPAAQVARLDQSQGTIRLYSDESGVAAEDTATLFAGQTLRTGKDSAAGLTWAGGGSLRIDAQTRIEFVSADEIFLHAGRVYFDSYGADNKFAVQSEHGLVAHIGTQYMAEAGANGLVVSVREGEVTVTGAHDQTVHSGQRATLSGSSRPVITNTNGVGADWAWIETVSPGISVDGMSAYDFLQWVGRETGHAIHFASEAAEQIARTTHLKGAVNADPRNELRLRMMTMDLDAEFDPEGAVILLSD
ncbi:MAG: FecR family protein [Woeseiaceae bacterium]